MECNFFGKNDIDFQSEVNKVENEKKVFKTEAQLYREQKLKELYEQRYRSIKDNKKDVANIIAWIVVIAFVGAYMFFKITSLMSRISDYNDNNRIVTATDYMINDDNKYSTTSGDTINDNEIATDDTINDNSNTKVSHVISSYSYDENSIDSSDNMAFDNYTFGNGVSVNIPYDMKTTNETDNYLLLTSLIDDSELIYVFYDKATYNRNALESILSSNGTDISEFSEMSEHEMFHRLLVHDESRTEIDKIITYKKNINYKDVYYSTFIEHYDRTNSLKSNIIYTVDLPDKYFVLANLGIDDFDYDKYEQIISSIEE